MQHDMHIKHSSSEKVDVDVLHPVEQPGYIGTSVGSIFSFRFTSKISKSYVMVITSQRAISIVNKVW